MRFLIPEDPAAHPGVGLADRGKIVDPAAGGHRLEPVSAGSVDEQRAGPRPQQIHHLIQRRGHHLRRALVTSHDARELDDGLEIELAFAGFGHIEPDAERRWLSPELKPGAGVVQPAHLPRLGEDAERVASGNGFPLNPGQAAPPHHLAVLGVYELPDRAGGQVLAAVAGDPAGHVVRVDQARGAIFPHLPHEDEGGGDLSQGSEADLGLAQGPFPLDPFGHVLLDHHEVTDLAALDRRRDGHLLGVEAAVLTSVDQGAPPHPSREDGVPHFPVETGILDTGFEQAEVAAEELFPAVAGELG